MSNEAYQYQLEKGNNRLAREIKALEDKDHKTSRIWRFMVNQTTKQRSPILMLIHQESWQEFWLTKTEKTLYLPTEFNRNGFVFRVSARYHDANMHQRI